VPVVTGRTLQAALGKKQVSGAVTVAIDDQGRAQAGTEQTIACDLICVSTGSAAANGLLYQSGCQLEFDARSGMFIPVRLAANVYAAGDVTGPQALGACLAAGRAAGIQAMRNAEGSGPALLQSADPPTRDPRSGSPREPAQSAIETVPPTDPVASVGKR